MEYTDEDDHRVKLKVNKTLDKYQNFVRKLKEVRNIKKTVILAKLEHLEQSGRI